MYRCWKLLERLHKAKRSIVYRQICSHFQTKIDLININELHAIDRYNLDSFPSSLDKKQSSVSLRIIKRLGAEWFLVAVLAVFLSSCCNTRCLYIDYGDMITSIKIYDHVIGYN